MSAAASRGPIHEVDAGRYYAEIVDGIPMIFRADTVGAVTHIESAALIPFQAAPRWLRFVRRSRRVWRWRLLRVWFALPFTGGDEIVGSYTRERRGTRETVEVTRRQDAHSKFVVVPPGEWPQDEADWAIRRGQELAEKYGW